MKATLISIGTELLFGQTINTNVAFLSKELNALGIDVMYHVTVGDNPKRLEEAIKNAFKDCDMILTTGGLGPTQDDLTKEVVAKALDDKMIRDEESLNELLCRFEKSKRPMTENNLKQADFPSRSVIFKNPNGTAPGFALEKEGKYVLCFPGPPREMIPMYENMAKPFLEKITDSSLVYFTIRQYGIGESLLETMLLPLITNQTDPTIATYAKEGECTIRVASKRKKKEEAEEACKEIIDQIKEIIGDTIYSLEDRELNEVVGKLLIENNITISTAESCTGGLLASSLTDISGISQVFDRGFVTYSNRAKQEELGVNEKTLNTYGAVSEEVAREMVDGLYKKTKSRLCISITGIAGPGGGSKEKPVGLVFIGICFDGIKNCYKVKLRNANRVSNKNSAKLQILHLIYKTINTEK